MPKRRIFVCSEDFCFTASSQLTPVVHDQPQEREIEPPLDDSGSTADEQSIGG